MDRTRAAESVYRERATPVDDMQSWARYMEVDGRGGSEWRCVALQYCEEGLLDVRDDVAGTAAAFGDDIAIQGLCSALRRDIHVVQARAYGGGGKEAQARGARPGLSGFLRNVSEWRPSQVHGSDVGVVGEAAVFFLPHKPPGEPPGDPLPPLFLLMRGTGWCALRRPAGPLHVELSHLFMAGTSGAPGRRCLLSADAQRPALPPAPRVTSSGQRGARTTTSRSLPWSGQLLRAQIRQRL